MTNTIAFNPLDFLSDEPITDGERIILNKALDKTKVHLFYKNNSGFLASLIATLEFTWDRSIPTACTNGVFMAWNPEFYLSLSPESRVTVLAHEAWHIAFQHMFRCGSRHPEDYNSAGDQVINNLLENHSYDMTGFPYLLDAKYKNMSTEQVYDILAANRIANGGNPWNPQNGDFSSPGSGPDSITKGMTPDQITKKAQGNIIDAATIAKMSNNAGNMPSEVSTLIDKFLSPKLPWQELLFLFFDALSNQEYSYKAMNRRYQDPVLPGKTTSQGLEHIIYYLDVSGSTSDADVIRFNSEVKYIKDAFNPEKLTLVTFDTKIQNEYIFEEDDDFDQIVITGRGGTSLKEVFKHAEKNDPTAIVIFTDLYVSIPPIPPKVPLIWICVNNPNAKVPYGHLICIKEENA